MEAAYRGGPAAVDDECPRLLRDLEVHDRGDASAPGRSHLRHLLVQAIFIPANKQNGRASRSQGAHGGRPDAGTCSGDDHRLARESPVKAGFCTYARQRYCRGFSQLVVVHENTEKLRPEGGSASPDGSDRVLKSSAHIRAETPRGASERAVGLSLWCERCAALLETIAWSSA